MRIKSAKFISSANGVTKCPQWALPEIALIGRSNVGKSSLINMLCNQHSLAKVSGTPGKTRLLNFFLINETWSLVDLPGYGFAKASRADKHEFNRLVGDYIEQRENLRCTCVLIDSRHEPQRIDLEFLAWLHSIGGRCALVFTKADKQSAAKTQANIALFQEAIHPILGYLPEHTAASALKKTGRLETLAMLSAILG